MATSSLPPRRDRRRTGERTVWSGAAFVTEALVLLLFLVACLAVLMQLFGAAEQQGADSMRRQQAVALAVNQAERFAADPAGAGDAADVADPANAADGGAPTGAGDGEGA